VHCISVSTLILGWGARSSVCFGMLNNNLYLVHTALAATAVALLSDPVSPSPVSEHLFVGCKYFLSRLALLLACFVSLPYRSGSCCLSTTDLLSRAHFRRVNLSREHLTQPIDGHKVLSGKLIQLLLVTNRSPLTDSSMRPPCSAGPLPKAVTLVRSLMCVG